MASGKVPLDEQHVTEPCGAEGGERCLPALHPDRKEDRCFITYRPPPIECSPALVGEFLEHAQFIADDLEWLLALPHDKFWCQVVFDESLQKCLDSYLRLAPRGLDPAMLPASPAVAEMQKRLHRSVFMTFLRMATHKESKENFITPAVFGEIIYNNYLFDIPKILDLCVLFGKGNSQLLHKMIDQKSGINSLDTLLALLQAEGAKVEEETENMADSFLGGDVSLDAFVDEYQKQRKLAHLRRVKIDKLQEMVLKGPRLPRGLPQGPLPEAQPLDGSPALQSRRVPPPGPSPVTVPPDPVALPYPATPYPPIPPRVGLPLPGPPPITCPPSMPFMPQCPPALPPRPGPPFTPQPGFILQ